MDRECLATGARSGTSASSLTSSSARPSPPIVSADPAVHVERIRQLAELGGTVVALMNLSGAAPEEAPRVYGRDVLPKLRA